MRTTYCGDYILHTDPALTRRIPAGGFRAVDCRAQPSTTWAVFPNGTPPNLCRPGLRQRSRCGVPRVRSTSQAGSPIVETAYAKNVGLPVASVVNRPATRSSQRPRIRSAALEGATLRPDLTENLSGVFDDGPADAYPISAYSYFVTQCVPAQATAQNVSCDGTAKPP